MMDDQTTPTPRSGRRWLRRAVLLFAVAALVVPAAAWAGHQFTDVPNSNIFHADIDWMADNGVTRGCNPPDNDRFCPEGFVTREQMAAFMHRLETEGVFIPGDAAPRFAVVEYNLNVASLEASSGLESWTREGTGRYLLTFDRDVSDCAWTATLGARNNATYGSISPTVYAHSVASNSDQIRVQVKNASSVDEDRTFNLVVTC